MPLEETINTFTYLITEANKLKIAYIMLVRYVESSDPTKRGTPHDIIETYGHLITRSHTKFLTNGDFTPQEAARFVRERTVDGVFFGMLFIGHPDLAQRIQYGKLLGAQVDAGTIYGSGRDEVTESIGYTDYATAMY